jgi:beta-galactosidase
MDQLDLGGYNYIDRLYANKTYAPEHERFPHRLFLGTETSNQVHNWLGVRDHDYVIGEFIWTGIDYLGESHRLPRRGSEAGFLDLAGGRKPEFYRRAAYWRSDPVLQLSVLTGEKPEFPWRVAPALIKWNWPAGSQRTVRAVTNCEEVEVFLNDRSLGRHPVSPDVYTSEWTVPYAPGVLSATAYRGGKKIVTQELRTAGAAARLQVTPLAIPVAGDLALYEITVVDAAGVRVLDAVPTVKVGVAGAGRLIGLDTGDLDYGGLFKVNARKAYQGRLLATVQRTAPAGDFRLTVTAAGLPKAVLISPPNAGGGQ